MYFIKTLILLLFISVNLFASMEKDIIFVENLDKKEINIKDEFFNQNSKFYTITLATLNYKKLEPIHYFKSHKLTNALAYKTGKDSNVVVISGVYKSYKDALKGINNLDATLKSNKPYINKIKFHQDSFETHLTKTTPKKSIVKKTKKEIENSVFISNSEYSKKLKDEFFNENSDYYSIAVATIPFTKTSIKTFLEENNITDGALAHVFGKNKDKVRIIYGVYKTRKEANNAIKFFNDNLKSNSPFSMEMAKFQSFYQKNFPLKKDDDSIVELKIKQENENETLKPVKLNDNLKIIENKELKKTEKKIEKKHKKLEEKPIKKETKAKKIAKPVKKEDINKIIKQKQEKYKFLKETSLEDVYFIESDGNFNILSEVFLNDESSFYTIDLGEVKLKETTIEEYYENNNLKDNSLAYKYGENKDYARVIYGAYETKNDAQNDIKNLPLVDKKTIRVSNIKNHQKLYRTFHKNIKKVQRKPNLPKDILYLENNEENFLIREFFNLNSDKYTITIVTVPKDSINLDNYLYNSELRENVLVYSLGTSNNYYRVFNGLYNSFNEARIALEKLSDELKSNNPYISRVKTIQDKFESYNQRRISDYKTNTLKINF